MNIMKKIIALSLLALAFTPVTTINVAAKENNDEPALTESNVYEAHFDMSNPNKQEAILYDAEGQPIVISIGEELSPSLTRGEIIKNGTFDRIFAAQNGIFNMQARFKGTCNPYITRFTSVSGGIFRAIGATFIRERHGSTTAANDPNMGVGLYQVDYTLPDIGGTFTASLEVYLRPGQTGAEAIVMIRLNP